MDKYNSSFLKVLEFKNKILSYHQLLRWKVKQVRKWNIECPVKYLASEKSLFSFLNSFYINTTLPNLKMQTRFLIPIVLYILCLVHVKLKLLILVHIVNHPLSSADVVDEVSCRQKYYYLIIIKIFLI